MSAQRYYDRLYRARIIWSILMASVWIIYMLAAPSMDGWQDVTIFLAVIWALGYPRNWARFKARRATSTADFSEAANREIHR